MQNNISTVFPSVTKEEIKNLYKMRSEFVHGKCSVGSCQLIEETIDLTEDFIESSRLATALLLATIRKLIKNNSKGIKFWNTVSFEYER